MRKRMSFVCPVVCLTVILGFTALALAGDINPPPGPVGPTMKTLVEVEPRSPISLLPITISEPGSYYLTQNLTGTTGSDGIVIAADDVTVDLNGFSLIGVPGTLSAVAVPVAHVNLTLRNGTIRDWGGAVIDGLDRAANSRVTELRVQYMGGGIALGDRSLVTACIVNTIGTGVNVGSNSIIQNCSITSSGSMGIWLAGTVENVSILDCVVSNCGNDGIRVAGGSRNCVVRNCIVSRNRRHGILFGQPASPCLIVGNLCNENGQGADVSNGHGIFLDGVGRVEGNHCASQAIGIQASGIVVKNSCNNNGTNYLITGGVVSNNPATAGPWANLEN